MEILAFVLNDNLCGSPVLQVFRSLGPTLFSCGREDREAVRTRLEAGQACPLELDPGSVFGFEAAFCVTNSSIIIVADTPLLTLLDLAQRVRSNLGGF
jgi:hypothetical protein